jgi:hypothetical protein
MPKGLEAQSGFKKFQIQFTRHIRDPKKHPRPRGVPARRMGVYNTLLFNNIEGVLAACFPVLKLILKSRRWKELVRDFFSEHKCHSPFFREVPKEFLEYLEKERKPRKFDPCFLKYLAHYEWIELDLFVTEEGPEGSVDNSPGDLLNEKPVFRSALKLVSYPYSVHLLSPDYQPKKPEKERSYYLVFRNRDDEVEFIKLNPLTARLVELLLKRRLTGRKALEKICKLFKMTDPNSIRESGLKILEKFREKGAILGTSCCPLPSRGCFPTSN